MSDGEEGHTTDHSHSGTPDVVSTNTDDRLDDRSDDLLSQGSEIPADNTDPAQASDGLSERDGGLGQAKAQLDAGQNPNEVKHLHRGSHVSVFVRVLDSCTRTYSKNQSWKVHSRILTEY